MSQVLLPKIKNPSNITLDELFGECANHGVELYNRVMQSWNIKQDGDIKFTVLKNRFEEENQ